MGPLLLEAEQNGVEMEIGFPIITGPNGMEVVDWIGLEAILCVLLQLTLLNASS